MMKCEAVKTIFKSEDYGLEDHTLTIDKIVELDPQGNVMLTKYVAYVIAHWTMLWCLITLHMLHWVSYLIPLRCGFNAVVLAIAMLQVSHVNGTRKRYTHGWQDKQNVLGYLLR